MKLINRRRWLRLLLFGGIGIALLNFQRIDEFWERRYRNSPDKKTSQLIEIELSKCQTGDLIFRRGFGGISEMIAIFAQSGPCDVSHVGILLHDSSCGWEVAHAVSNKFKNFDGVVVEKLDHFLAESASQKVWVFRSGEANERQQFQIKRAVNRLQQQKIRFDTQWNWQDGSELYCSEMVIAVLADSAGVMQKPRSSDSLRMMYLDLAALYGRCSRICGAN